MNNFFEIVKALQKFVEAINGNPITNNRRKRTILQKIYNQASLRYKRNIIPNPHYELEASDSRGRLGPPEGMSETGGSGLARVRGHVKNFL